MLRRLGLAITSALLLGASTVHAQSTQTAPIGLKTQYVMLVISDGVRWQEVFAGADASQIGRAHV